ncbi:MAG: DUF5681 domain-containing protein [Phenylobacterium sp.]|jgi:hypothetical protein
MNDTPRNNAPKTRGRPFAAGNPGRPKGARHKITRAVEALLEGEAEALTRKAVEAALDGDMTALRLCLDRLAPARRDAPVRFDLGLLDGPTAALEATARAIEAMAEGELTPTEAAAVVGLLEAYRKAFETVEIERRLAALENAK